MLMRIIIQIVWCVSILCFIVPQTGMADSNAIQGKRKQGNLAQTVRKDSQQKSAAKQKAKPKTQPKRIAPTFKNVSYGPHKRQVLNFWKAESDKPTPLLIQIHGGGWRGGNKAETASPSQIADGVSYCTISYRLTGTNILPAPVHDAARAIQFIRTKKEEWNIDTDRIVLTGGSAGAASSLWLAFHDDLADPKSEDPVLRESSRVAGAVANGGQTTLDPFVILEKIGSAGAMHPMIWASVGAKSLDDLKANWKNFQKLSAEFSAINHVSKDDPPVYIRYGKMTPTPVEQGKGDGIHHPMFGKLLKDKCDEVGVTCHFEYAGGDKPKVSPADFMNKLFGK